MASSQQYVPPGVKATTTNLSPFTEINQTEMNLNPIRRQKLARKEVETKAEITNVGRDVGLLDLIKYAYERRYGVFIRPPSPYSGNIYYSRKEDMPEIIQNPYSVSTQIRGFGSKQIGTLLPGQGYSTATGRFDNPNLHADTARRLNDQMNARLARETDISRATTADTTRGMASALSTLDDLYVGSYRTQVTKGKQLSKTAQANQVGITQTSNKTLLGRASGN